MEWLYHIGVPVDQIEDMATNSANTVPVMMPYIDAFFMPRAFGDRPDIVPKGAVNFAFLGQFAETGRDTIFTTEYSMRTGMEAVYTLLDIDRGVPEVWGSTYDVRCLIDEAANIGQIPRLEKLVATIRSREISCCLVLQAQSQLKALYKDSADTIIGNMDCSIFLGGKEPGTLKELAAALGKETIDSYNTGESRGREVSHSLNYQKLGKDMPYLFVKSSVALNLS